MSLGHMFYWWVYVSEWEVMRDPPIEHVPQRHRLLVAPVEDTSVQPTSVVSPEVSIVYVQVLVGERHVIGESGVAPIKVLHGIGVHRTHGVQPRLPEAWLLRLL